jgi:chromosome segregation ATPase
LTTANAQVTSLQSQLDSANFQVTSLQSQLTTANAQVTSLQSQLNTANAQIASLQSQLDSVQSARHFNTKSELTSWLNSLPSSLKNWDSFSNALARQNQAAEDGYIYSVYVDGDYWGEEAIAGNTLYWIDSDGSLVSLGTIS